MPLPPNTQDAYTQLEDMDVEVVPCHFKKLSAIAHNDGLLAIDYSKLKTSAEELEVLLHEIGHFQAGAFYTQQDSPIQRARAEARATRHVFEHFYPPSLLAGLIHSGHAEAWQLAECLGLPERFVREMLCFYTDVRRVDFGVLCQSSVPEDTPTPPETAQAPSHSMHAAHQPNENMPPTQPEHWVRRQMENGATVELLVAPDATPADIEAALATILSQTDDI